MSSSPPMEQIPEGTKILNYTVGGKIGRGAFGEIYSALDDHGILWALKTESNMAEKKTLAFEFQVLSQIQSSPHFPRLGVIGESNSFHFISMELLGPSLSTIVKGLQNHRFSMSTAVRSSYHILKCIESLHIFGYIHRDIKPGNILTREGTDHPLCLIDFGLSRLYVDPANGRHRPQRRKVGFRGTKAYASIHAFLYEDLSRRDDLISWFYLSFEMIFGYLPWRGITDRAQVLSLKRNWDVGQAVSAVAPELFEIWRHISNLEFEENPNYNLIFASLNHICKRIDCSLSDSYDWTEDLRKNRREMAHSLDCLMSNFKISEGKKYEAVEPNIETQLLSPQASVPSPFSVAEEPDEFACC